ncbi:hypothetical protein HMPREF1548_01561 [Clostridium sp. KLE 1755]|nr:hypothetical protein HMPREF1548_01561 [Clostridium sp. KLE 1755]
MLSGPSHRCRSVYIPYLRFLPINGQQIHSYNIWNQFRKNKSKFFCCHITALEKTLNYNMAGAGDCCLYSFVFLV